MGVFLVAEAIAMNIANTGRIMHRMIFAALLIFLATGHNAVAQNKPDFNGTWKLNVAKSDYGDRPGPSSRIETIEEHDGTISDSVVSVMRSKTYRYTLVFPTNGQKTEVSANGGIDIGYITLRSISAVWQGNALAVTEALQFESSDFLEKDLYTLSADKKSLTIAVSISGHAIARYVLDR